MANLGRLTGPGRGAAPPGLEARSDAELSETLKSRIAALICALIGIAVGGTSFLIPARDAQAEFMLLTLLTAGTVGVPFAVHGIARVVTEQRTRQRRRRAEARARLERESAVRRRMSAAPAPRSVAEARRDSEEDVTRDP